MEWGERFKKNIQDLFEQKKAMLRSQFIKAMKRIVKHTDLKGKGQAGDKYIKTKILLHIARELLTEQGTTWIMKSES